MNKLTYNNPDNIDSIIEQAKNVLNNFQPPIKSLEPHQIFDNTIYPSIKTLIEKQLEQGFTIKQVLRLLRKHKIYIPFLSWQRLCELYEQNSIDNPIPNTSPNKKKSLDKSINKDNKRNAKTNKAKTKKKIDKPNNNLDNNNKTNNQSVNTNSNITDTTNKTLTNQSNTSNQFSNTTNKPLQFSNTTNKPLVYKPPLPNQPSNLGHQSTSNQSNKFNDDKTKDKTDIPLTVVED